MCDYAELFIKTHIRRCFRMWKNLKSWKLLLGNSDPIIAFGNRIIIIWHILHCFQMIQWNVRGYFKKFVDNRSKILVYFIAKNFEIFAGFSSYPFSMLKTSHSLLQHSSVTFINQNTGPYFIRSISIWYVHIILKLYFYVQ